jgi:Family of unknown function (DUF6510)
MGVFLNVGGPFVNDRGVVPPSARQAVVAAPLQDIFAVEVPTAVVRCDTCGRTGATAELRVFDHAPSVVARYPICDQVLLRLVRPEPRAACLPAISRIRRDPSHLRIGCSCALRSS